MFSYVLCDIDKSHKILLESQNYGKLESQKNRKGNEEITGKLVIKRKLLSRKSENRKAERDIWSSKGEIRNNLVWCTAPQK